MKGIIVCIIAMFLSIGVSVAEESIVGNILSGEHRLGYSGVLSTILVPEIANTVVTNPKSYFLVVKNKDGIDVIFSWKINNEYVVSRLPVTKVRVRYDNEVDDPYVIFKWRPANNTTYIDVIMNECVIYAVFVCKPEIWNLSNVSTNVLVDKELKLEKSDN